MELKQLHRNQLIGAQTPYFQVWLMYFSVAQLATATFPGGIDEQNYNGSVIKVLTKGNIENGGDGFKDSARCF